jgi:Carboxylesterase family
MDIARLQVTCVHGQGRSLSSLDWPSSSREQCHNSTCSPLHPASKNRTRPSIKSKYILAGIDPLPKPDSCRVNGAYANFAKSLEKLPCSPAATQTTPATTGPGPICRCIKLTKLVPSNADHLTIMKLFSALATSFALSAPALSQLLVPTEQGSVLGTTDGANVRRWLGVPYAVANRWEAPQAPPKRSSVYSATKFGDSCHQNLSPSTLDFLNLVGGAGVNLTESENCLSVNIWSPRIGRKQNTAVLVWIHGGGFSFGTVCPLLPRSHYCPSRADHCVRRVTLTLTMEPRSSKNTTTLQLSLSTTG